MKIGVIGLGYVGWPLATALAEQGHEVVGYDLDQQRVSYLRGDARLESLQVSDKPSVLRDMEVAIVCVPTDIDQAKQPVLYPLSSAAQTVGSYCKRLRLVVNESTVYPGATDELFRAHLPAGVDLAYSPERIVPGSPHGGELHGGGRNLANTVKIVACESDSGLSLLRQVYGPICGGLHECRDLREAEMAKLMENCQRDLNIALMNEAAVLADRLGVSFTNVLKAAGTKWNFHPYQPGLVGGHCIGVDPYYLAWAGARRNFHAQVILAGRQVNDRMGHWLARKVIKDGHRRVLVCGYTFKENCADVRNTRVEDVRQELQDFGAEVVVYDPLVEKSVARRMGVLTSPDAYRGYSADAILLAVPHSIIIAGWSSIRECLSGNDRGAVYDLKNALTDEPLAIRL